MHMISRLACFSLILALTGWAGGSIAASAPQEDIETYVDEALPESSSWGALNGPLKAGDLKLLPRPSKKEKPAEKAQPAKDLPIGSLKAPSIQDSNKEDSAAADMMMRGLKSALIQIGENPDVLKSSLKTEEEKEAGQAINLLRPPKLPQSNQVEITPPKATELTEAPQALADAPEVAPTSIFGKPVRTAEKAPETTSCDPVVKPWIKACGEAGYPEDFIGQITGESRVLCPGSEIQDVWLTNSCAPPLVTASDDVKSEEKAPEVKSSKPISLTEKTEQPLQKTGQITLNDNKQAGQIVLSDGEPTKLLVEETPEKESFAVPPQEAPIKPTSPDGVCGSTNGLAVASKPSENLCDNGTATDVEGTGPWHWNCEGLKGGIVVSCASPVDLATQTATAKKARPADSILASAFSPEVQDGTCGAAHNRGYESKPTTDLCAKGIASDVNGKGPWHWACSGTNGGTAQACKAPMKTDGLCGSANKKGFEQKPQDALCAAGYASAVTGEGPWNWTCAGLYSGQDTTCSATKKINAICGAASLNGHQKAPEDKLCMAGQPSVVTGEGPWNWSCVGASGGASVTCDAPKVKNGVCGDAHGLPFLMTPDQDLCAAGTASRVTGVGPWNWTCLGIDGGTTSSCTAPKGTEEEIKARAVTCGSASTVAALSAPSENLCINGKAGNVTRDAENKGPWTWSCKDRFGLSIGCSTLSPTSGVCGKSVEGAFATAPTSGLCVSGLPTSIEKSKDEKTWSWHCKGALGGSDVVCKAGVTEPKEGVKALPQQATSLADAVKKIAYCGEAVRTPHTSKPTHNLCLSGKAGDVKGVGPWTWTCEGENERKAVCEAMRVVNGSCGSVNGTIQKIAPTQSDTKELCQEGLPTELEGTGPWLWSCIGQNGGSSSSCSATSEAMARVDGTCGEASNSLMTHAPRANLCDTGIQSSVHGNGPWTWTCSGKNGGIASTCMTSKILPKAPPPPGPAVNGMCGVANGVAMVGRPLEGLCAAGVETETSGQGPWNWSCIGLNGGMTVSCTAPLLPPDPIEGVCGRANGVTSMTKPRSGLCSSGISGTVNGQGPWTWSCSGTNGGGAVSCTTPKAGMKHRGIPSLVTPSISENVVPDKAPDPVQPPRPLVTPRLPSGSLPPLESGTLPELKPTSPIVDLDIKTKPVPAPANLYTGEEDLPEMAADLPEGTEGLPPPPIRDHIQPKKAKQVLAEEKKNLLTEFEQLELPSELSTMAFVRGSRGITKTAEDTVRKLAEVLKANITTRITLVAYADNSTITPRQARRLSLARALNVRDALVTLGVPSRRIDVRALGANVPSGNMDRIDVKVN